jgi:outer membrane immunogenic protein
MKSRFAVIAMAFAAVGTIALGADQASADGYSSPRSYVAPYNWSGIYGGVNVGWMSNEVDWAFNPAVPGGANPSFSASNDSAIYGGHAGAQYQFGSLVVGGEIAIINRFDRDWFGGNNYGINPAFNAQSKLDNTWTIGPRLGWAHGRWLFYTTGGYAQTEIETQAIVRATGLSAGAPFAGSSRHDGWYIGGGIEHAFHGNLIVGLEYQHLEFDTHQQCPQGNCVTGAAGFNNRDIDGTADIVRARLSYKFGVDRDAPRPLK